MSLVQLEIILKGEVKIHKFCQDYLVVYKILFFLIDLKCNLH